MRQRLIVANWKMNTTLSEALKLTKLIGDGVRKIKNTKVVLCPPAVWLYPLSKTIKNRKYKISLGVQNIYFLEKGNFTGEISPAMVKGISDYVIIGHSERRRIFAENDELINKKVQAALKNNLKPIICVGEFEKNNSSNYQPFGSIFHQLSKAIKGVSVKQISNVIIAYEPVWAIGTGNPATGKYAKQMISSLRDRLSIIYDRQTVNNIKILYGGSVDEKNISEFTNQPGIDGVLVGGASLEAKEFLNICRLVVQ